MGAVFFCLLRHETDVRHAADGRGIEGSVLLAVLDDGLVDRRVAAVGDHREGVVELPVRPPHLPGVSDDDGHGRVDDDVVGHMQVRNALIRIHHRQGRAFLVDGLDIGLDLGPLGLRQALDLRVELAQAIVDIHAQALDDGRVLLEHVLVEDGYGVSEHHRIGNLHHRGLEVQRQEQAILFRGLDLLRVEAAQGDDIHHCGVDDLALQQGGLLLQDLHASIGAHELDPHLRGLRNSGGGLAAVEVAAVHVRDARLRFGVPGTHLVGVLLREVLHG